MPTLAAATVSDSAVLPASGRVLRFNRTERWVHAVQALTFLILLFTGLAISITQLEAWIGHRELLRQIHLTSAFFFVFGPALVALAGDRISIRQDISEIEDWSRDDIRWLAHPSTRPDSFTPPPGRYNAGQKLNAIFTVYSTLVFGVTGVILWQNRRFPFHLVSQANTLHQYLAYFALLAFLGHLYLSVIHPATRASLRGIIVGTVGEDWAKHHHPRWKPALSRQAPLIFGNVARSLGLLVIGLEGALLLTRFGFELLGANVTDPVIKLIYQYSGFPGTAQNAATSVGVFDLGSIVWCGLAVALWYGMVRNFSLLPRLFAPAKG